MSGRRSIRVEFTKQHDSYLYKYLATYCPSKEGRSGHRIFQLLVANERDEWPWSTHHTWQSWRERYVKNADYFDRLIHNYQKKHNIKPMEEQKRAAEPTPIERLAPPAKRTKLEAKKDPSSETRTVQDSDTQHASSSSQRSKLASQHPPEPQKAPAQAHPLPETKLTDARLPFPPRSSTNMNIDATNKPSLGPLALQTRHNTLEISPSLLNRPIPPPTEGEPEPCATKRIKERPRAPSEVFASGPSTPKGTAADDVGRASITDTAPPRAPPRIVDSLHGRVLVDGKGHVPHLLPRGEDDVAKEVEKHENKTQWPPSRGRTTKQGTASGSGVGDDVHHPFSQSELQPRAEAPREATAMAEMEQGKQLYTFAPQNHDEALSDRRVVAALSSAEVGHGVAPRVESKQRTDVIPNGTFPVKRVVPTHSRAPLSGLTPNPTAKAFKFPLPRASTRSPFGPEPPAKETHHAAPHQPSQIRAARHPALRRIRRQTIAHEHGNVHESGHEHGRGQVPSIDLVSLSRSSVSARSHSHSSTGGLVPARTSRWSLPSFAHAAPWVIDEPEGAPSARDSASGSGSGSPSGWVAPSPLYANAWRHPQTSSVGGTSTPRFKFTSSPARSVRAVATNVDTSAPVPQLDVMHTSPSLSLSPHPKDVSLAASHGLASLLAHMSANHGLALGVVEAVYARVRSLRDADEVLGGMREAAEGFGEREIERRNRQRKNGGRYGGSSRAGHGGKAKERARGSGNGKEGEQLRSVVASEDGERSEYSPPETSRAAMWKRQSESLASYGDEGVVGEMVEGGEGGEERREVEEEEEEEEEEGRAVEDELCGRDGESSEDGLSDGHDGFSQALLENTRAYELERKMGRVQFHRNIVKRFM